MGVQKVFLLALLGLALLITGWMVLSGEPGAPSKETGPVVSGREPAGADREPDRPGAEGLDTVPFRDDSRVKVSAEFVVDSPSPGSGAVQWLGLPPWVPVVAVIGDLPGVPVERPGHRSGHFAAPAPALRVRFEAAGYEPVKVDLPPAVDGSIDVGVVRFRPAGILEVVITGAPPDAPSPLAVICGPSADEKSSFCVGYAKVQARDDEGRWRIRVPASAPLSVTLYVPGAVTGEMQPLTKVVPSVPAGEPRSVLFDLGVLSWFTFQVHGLPEVEGNPAWVRLRQQGAQDRAWELLMRFSAAVSSRGRVTFGFGHRVLFTAEIGLREGGVPLIRVDGEGRVFSKSDQGLIDVRPAEPLVAVGLLEGGVHLVDRSFALLPPGNSSPPGRNRNGYQLSTLKTATNPASILTIAGRHDRRLEDCSVHWPGPDILEIQVPAAGAAARAQFHWSSPAKDLKAARLVPPVGDGKQDWWHSWFGRMAVEATSVDAKGARFGAIPPGEYRLGLDFRSGEARKRMILPQVHRFQAGEELELTIDPPGVAERLVIVSNWKSIPAPMRPAELKLVGAAVSIRSGRSRVLDVLHEPPRVRFFSPTMPDPVDAQGTARADGRVIEVAFPVQALSSTDIPMRPVAGGYPFVQQSDPGPHEQVQTAGFISQGHCAASGQAVRLVVPREGRSVFTVWERFTAGRTLHHLFRGRVSLTGTDKTWEEGPEGRELRLRVPGAWGRVQLVVRPGSPGSHARDRYATASLRIGDEVWTWIPRGAASLRLTCPSGTGRQITRDVEVAPGQTALDLR